MILRHLHLPGLTPYLRASAIQDHLVSLQLAHKASPSAPKAPDPVLLTFETSPTYTCGRREIGNLPKDQISYLRAGGRAEFFEALRGGQTTFHGPGQLTAYLVLSLQEHGLNTRSYIQLLEDSTIGTCAEYSLKTHTTQNPGVWIGPTGSERKLASVGVHLRRHIASHGVGLNVSVDIGWFDRIIACGLPDRKATNIENELNNGHQVQGLEAGNSAQREAKSADCLLPKKSVLSPSHTNIPILIQDVATVLSRNVAQRLPAVNSRVEAVADIGV